ncbi:MAG TPA: hypothetical protein VFF83_01735 [Clostridia bacterium]|nr:hypothetical protein [Clostridia bacterium]
MIGKKMIFVLMGFMVIAFLTACRRNTPPVDNPPGHPQDDTHWKWKQLGFENGSVEKVQVTSDGRVFALSGGKLHLLEGGNWKAAHLDTDISTFYLSEKGVKGLIVAGGFDGKLYLYSIEDSSWNVVEIGAIPEPIDIVTASPSTGEIYVGQSSKYGGGLWRGTGGGAKWEKLTDITVRGIAVHPEDPEIIYMVDKVTYLSTDGGKSWAKVETGANYGVLIHPLYPETAYLAYAQGVVSARHDGTITSQQQFYLPGGMTRLEFNPASLNEWALGLWDYPSGVGGLYYSFNGGGHWLEVGEKMKDTRILDLCFDKDGKTLYMGTADNGLWALNVEELKKDSKITRCSVME